MNDDIILADSFLVKRHRLRIFRIVHRNSATLIWTSRKHALRYLQRIQDKKLQAEKEGQ